jgi:hypothetical protein
MDGTDSPGDRGWTTNETVDIPFMSSYTLVFNLSVKRCVRVVRNSQLTPLGIAEKQPQILHCVQDDTARFVLICFPELHVSHINVAGAFHGM